MKPKRLIEQVDFTMIPDTYRKLVRRAHENNRTTIDYIRHIIKQLIDGKLKEK